MWEWFIDIGVWIVVAVVVGVIIFFCLQRWVPRLVARIVPEPWRKVASDTQRLVSRLIMAACGLLMALVLAAVIVALLGIDIRPTLQAVGQWFLEHGLRILLIIVLAYLVYRILKLVIRHFVNRYVETKGKGRHSRSWFDKRESTLSGIINGIVAVLIIIIALFTILAEFGINITALIASAGVAGIAIGLAAQSLIKDIIQGLLILLEDQYNKDDVVKIAGTAGLVVEVTLRRTVLRDLDGILHSIPNSEVTTTSNYTRDLSRVNLNIPVAYGEDLDHVIAVLNRVGKELAADEYFGTLVHTAPQVLRVNNFGDSGIDIKMLGDTRPMKQWEVMGELRKRVKRAFDDEGIEIPWPHVKLYYGQEQGGTACAKCGRASPAGSLFCAHCGEPLAPKA